MEKFKVWLGTTSSDFAWTSWASARIAKADVGRMVAELRHGSENSTAFQEFRDSRERPVAGFTRPWRDFFRAS